MSSLRPTLGFALLLAACADEPAVDVGSHQNPAEDEVDAGVVPDAELPGPRVEFVGLADWLPAETTTRVLARAPEGVVRVELYLDGARIAELPFAPFELTWDTRPFGEGEHELRALAHLAGGGTAEVRRVVGFDHTPPAGSLPALAGYPEPFAVSASDVPSGVAKVIVTYPGGSQAVLDRAPFDFEWAGGCGSSFTRVAIVDRAGNQVELQQYYSATDTRDADCDGHRALAFPGGDDCNDAAWDIHPDAADQGTIAIDYDCDGTPGVDADGDGVASTGTHGSDCNDGDPALYGPLLEWWAPVLVPQVDPSQGVAVAQDGVATDVVHRAIDGSGEVDLVWTRRLITSDVVEAVEGEVVAAVGPVGGPLAVAPGPVIAFGDGPALRVARRGASGWDLETVEALGELESLSTLEVAVDSAGGVHLAYVVWNGAQSLGTLRQARRVSDAWEIETVGESSGGSVRLAVASDDVPHILYPTSGWYSHSRGFGATRTTTGMVTQLGPVSAADLRPSATLPGGVEVYGISSSWWSNSGEQVYRGEGVDEITWTELVASPVVHPARVELGVDEVVLGDYSFSYVRRTSPAGFAWQPLPGALQVPSAGGPLVVVTYDWHGGQRLAIPSGYREGAGCL